MMKKRLSRSCGIGVAAMSAAALLWGCTQASTAPEQTPAKDESVKAKGQEKKEGAMVKEHRSGDWSPGLTDEEKQTLFDIAKDTLEWSLAGRKGKFSFEKYGLTPKLKEKCATFVTFKNRGELRGCMGCLEAVEPMCLSVHTSASNASRDFRFTDNPITTAEVPELEMHVSLLSPRRKIESLDEFKIGQHGICLEKAGRSAVFLPEVAIEQKWNKDTTLTYLSRKAGLPSDAWREHTTFRVFESVVLAR